MCNICGKVEIVPINLWENEGNLDTFQIRKLLEDYFKRSGNKIDVYSPELILFIQNYLNSFQIAEYPNSAKNSKLLNNNIYNFSLAKSSGLLQDFKYIKMYLKEEEQEPKMKEIVNNSLGTQLVVEGDQVKHVMETTKPFIYKTRGKLLTYVTEGDSNVRPEHRKMAGTTLPVSDSFWQIAISHLGDWGCRCSIEEAEVKEITKRPDVKAVTPSEVISDVDLQSGKVLIFSENLPTFKNAPPIIRKRYR